jgi:hypothetical protein
MLFACIFLALCTFSCTTDNSLIPDSETSFLGKVTSDGAILTKTDKSLDQFFIDRFPTSEITLMEITEHPEDGLFYLYAEGVHNAPNAIPGAPIVMRWEIEEIKGILNFIKRSDLTKSDNGNDDLGRVGGFGESCTGDPCSYCKFNDPPLNGCWCARSNNNSDSKCNHTVTKD